MTAKFGDHRCYGNGDIDSYIKSYMVTLEKVTHTLIRHIARFLIPGIPIYNSEVPDTAGGNNKNTCNCKAFCVYAAKYNAT